MKEKIQFIINPFSGTSDKTQFEKNALQHLNLERYEPSFRYTEYSGHATKIAQAAVHQGIDTVVAVGGDGSINEIASALTHSDVNLGVVAAGSGNGFAHHHGISTDINKAIQNLNTGYRKTIDAVTINDEVFVNIAGVGYDAYVAFKTKDNPQRGIIPYIKESLISSTKINEFTFRLESYEKEITGEALMIIVANASTYGYSFTISPHSIDNDGLFEVIIIEKSSLLNYYMNAYRLLNNTILESPFIKTFRTDRLEISLYNDNYIHLDGEGKEAPRNLKFSLIPAALHVIVPHKKG